MSTEDEVDDAAYDLGIVLDALLVAVGQIRIEVFDLDRQRQGVVLLALPDVQLQLELDLNPEPDDFVGVRFDLP